MLILPGSNAHSHFRIEAMLTKISYEIPSLNAITAQFIHFIDVAQELTTDHHEKLLDLLHYGSLQNQPEEEITGELILVLPRRGTFSPWSDKATEIINLCGITEVNRIERGIAYYLQTSSKLTWGDIRTIGQFLHDPVTEQILYDFTDVKNIFEKNKPRPSKLIEFKEEGINALLKANTEMELALSHDELERLKEYVDLLGRNPSNVEVMMFAQLITKANRHKLFNAHWIIDDTYKPQSLLSMIKNTYQHNPRGILSAYEDNSAVIYGHNTDNFFCCAANQQYQFHHEPLHIAIKVETHNHPTAISPETGAASGIGGEIRDETATGRGTKPKAGLLGFSVSNVNIPGFLQAYEEENQKPKRLASPLEIMLEAPIGAAHFANRFGRPILCGYFRSFEFKQPKNGILVHYGYHKPIFISGGLGNIRENQLKKEKIKPGMLVILLGGNTMRIGSSKGKASSLAKEHPEAELLDFSTIQYTHAELARRIQDVINHCIALGDNNPIVALHDVGAGGIANAVLEFLWKNPTGANFELRNIMSIDKGLSPFELWCNEAQERFIIGMSPDNLPIFKKIADRENCPFAIIGEMTTSQAIVCHDNEFNNFPVDFPLSLLHHFSHIEKIKITTKTDSLHHPMELETHTINETEAISRLLTLPCIADKSFLITILDRSQGGLSVRDQLVGPWQVPVADCAVTRTSFLGFVGEAMSMGERPMLALLNSLASARMSVGEAITNIVASNIGALSDIRLSANWMAAIEDNQEALHLYHAVKALCLEFCPALNITIPVLQDSLSMQTVWHEEEKERKVISPVTLIISAFAPVMDVRKTLTPLLNVEENSKLIFIDLANGQQRLGGSSLAYVYSKLGETTEHYSSSESCPDVDDPNILKSFFNCIQQLNLDGKLLSYHDRSDGGLFVTLCEMAFATHVGLHIDISALGNDPIRILFNEELGAVIQVREHELDNILLQLQDHGLHFFYVIGELDKNDHMTVEFNDNIFLSFDRIELQQTWSELSFHIQKIRDNPRTAKKCYEKISDREDPGLQVELYFDINEDITDPFIKNNKKHPSVININKAPEVAILREQGCHGHVEMAAAFTKAGFIAMDVTMYDLVQNPNILTSFRGLAIPGGFSFGDVLGAGRGWAKRILFNQQLREQFEQFFHRADTFTFGVGNGCQMLTGIKELIPGANHWPHFIRNHSEQFESRLCLVEVQSSPSILLKGMESSRLIIPHANLEGRAEFENEIDQQEVLHQGLVALKFVDTRGRTTNIYPANPSGSLHGITGLTTNDGRVTIMMVHPERAFQTVQYSWHPSDWKEDAPWLRLFRNARIWINS